MEGENNYKWTKLVPKSHMAAPRHGHSSVALRNMVITFGGGREKIFNDTIVYNIDRNEWCVVGVGGIVPPPRASFGMAPFGGSKIMLFGGMRSNRAYLNDFYMLRTLGWNWERICAVGDIPSPRKAFSFTPVGRLIFMFGGITIGKDGDKHLLNDLFSVEPRTGFVLWKKVYTMGGPPCPRHAHTACKFIKRHHGEGSVSHLVVYGGMGPGRLGDLWFLNLDTLFWFQVETMGVIPRPRAMHTACLVQEKMLVFGGVVEATEEEKRPHMPNGFCTNALYVLHLDVMMWEQIVNYKDPCPVPMIRAEHSCCMIDNNMYVFSGRVGYGASELPQICYPDFWKLETGIPRYWISLRGKRLDDYIKAKVTEMQVKRQRLEAEQVIFEATKPLNESQQGAGCGLKLLIAAAELIEEIEHGAAPGTSAPPAPL